MTNIFRSRYVTEEHISLHSSASKLGLHKDRFDGIDENQIES